MKMNSKINLGFLGKLGDYISDNVSTCTMFGALITLAGALYAAYKASDEISEIRAQYTEKLGKIESSDLSEEEKAKEIRAAKSIRNVGILYAGKWAIGLGAASGGCMIATKCLDGITISGFAAAAYAERDKLKTWKDNAKQFLDEGTFKKIDDKSLEDLVKRNFVNEVGDPKALKLDRSKGQVFVDSNTGFFVQCEKQELLDAFEWGKEKFRNYKGYLDQAKWFEHLGLPPRENGKFRTWAPDIPFEPYIGTRTICGMTLESIEYKYQPQPRKNSGMPLMSGHKNLYI